MFIFGKLVMTYFILIGPEAGSALKKKKKMKEQKYPGANVL